MSVPKPGPIGEIAAAIIFLTRIPVRWHGPWPEDLQRRSMAWFPLVGGLVGAIGGMVLWACAAGAGLPAWIAAVLAIAAQMLATGAFHEDGLADSADGLGGGHDPARKLAIMRDSRLGTYGAAALWVALTLKAAALATLPTTTAALGLVLTGLVSRLGIVMLAAVLPPARTDGAAATVGRPGGRELLLAGTVTGAGTAILGWGLGADGPALVVAVILACVLAGGVVAWLARRHLGGITGDLLGASQQGTEITALVAFVALLEIV